MVFSFIYGMHILFFYTAQSIEFYFVLVVILEYWYMIISTFFMFPNGSNGYEEAKWWRDRVYRGTKSGNIREIMGDLKRKRKRGGDANLRKYRWIKRAVLPIFKWRLNIKAVDFNKIPVRDPCLFNTNLQFLWHISFGP